MNLIKLKNPFKKEKEQQETSSFPHPRLLEYYENGWVELVKGDDGEPFLIEGKRLYQIIDLENGLKMSRIHKINSLMVQAQDFGMTSENVRFNMNNIKSIRQAIADSRNNPDEVLNLTNQLDLICKGFELSHDTKLGEDLIFAIASICFVFQDEDPTDFNQREYERKQVVFRKHELSFFFYTHSFKVLSSLLKVSMLDMQSFMKEVMKASLESLKMNQLALIQYLNTSSISINDSEFLSLKKQVEMMKLQIECLQRMQLNFTTGLVL